MTDLFYQWPSSAYFGRRVPKEKFYERASINTALRERFVAEIDHVIWAYDLSQTTINLAGTDEVPNIAVFRVNAKGMDVSEQVLSAVDRSIPRPLIFEINRDVTGKSDIRMVAAHKQIGTGVRRLVSTSVRVGSLLIPSVNRYRPRSLCLPFILHCSNPSLKLRLGPANQCQRSLTE